MAFCWGFNENMKSITSFSKCVCRMALSANANLVKRTYKPNPVMQHDMEKCKTSWEPQQVFNYPPQHKYAVIILNCPIFWNHGTLFQVWEKAQVTITVDGGAQRWLKYLEDTGIDLMDGKHNQFIPDFITGDMDSCSPLVIEKFKTIGSIIVETPDQNDTDYSKALGQLGQYIRMENMNLDTVYVFAETSGRLDQITSNINTLYKSDKYIGNIKIIQIASNSLTWLLKPGFHTIAIPKILVEEETWCSLLPFGSPVKHITTTGLKWNLNDATIEFGGLVSSSNTYDKCIDAVTIDTDTPVIWSMGIEPLIECRHVSDNL